MTEICGFGCKYFKMYGLILEAYFGGILGILLLKVCFETKLVCTPFAHVRCYILTLDMYIFKLIIIIIKQL